MTHSSPSFPGKPLLWADGDDSGSIIDPTVNNLAGSSGARITARDAADFTQRFNDSHTWTFAELYQSSPPYMRVCA